MESDLHASGERSLSRLRRRLWLERMFFLVVIAVVVAYYRGALPALGGRVCRISAEGRPVTVVASQREAERLVEEIKRGVGPADRVKFKEKVSFQSVPAEGNPVQPEGKAIEALAARLTPLMAGEAIVVDGQPVVALPSKGEATKTISLLQREFAPSGSGFITAFKERLTVESREVPPDRFAVSAEEAVKKIREGAAPVSVHEVQPGETGSKIAGEAHVTLMRLKQANPGVDINKLHPGDKVKIPGKQLPITVVAQKEIWETVGEGARRRVQIIRVIYENGAQVSREVIGHRPVRPAPARPSPPAADGGGSVSGARGGGERPAGAGGGQEGQAR